MERMRILLIEDHLGERLSILKVLANFGAEVETAVTFNRARDLIQKREYHMIISEFLLNHCGELQGDGTEFWSYAKKIQPATPLILIANDATSLNTELIRMSAAANPQTTPNLTLPINLMPGVIPKPVRPDVLQALLEQRFHCVKKLAA